MGQRLARPGASLDLPPAACARRGSRRAPTNTCRLLATSARSLPPARTTASRIRETSSPASRLFGRAPRFPIKVAFDLLASRLVARRIANRGAAAPSVIVPEVDAAQARCVAPGLG